MAHPAVAATASEPVRVVNDTRDRQQLVHAARGQDEPVVADLVGCAPGPAQLTTFCLGSIWFTVPSTNRILRSRRDSSTRMCHGSIISPAAWGISGRYRK